MSIRYPLNPSAAPLPANAVARICKALGHPVRMWIVAYLKTEKNCFCGQLVDRLPLAQSTVSQHLKCLKEAGIVVGAIEGPGTCYRLDEGLIEQFQASLSVLLGGGPRPRQMNRRQGSPLQ